MQQAQEFWDGVFQTRGNDANRLVDVPDPKNPVYMRALQHFGDVRGKTLVDLGCGAGASSLFFASMGANVVSIDLSSMAIDNLKRYCAQQGIDNISARVLSAQDIGLIEPADFVFGAMILHHIEPFSQFAASLRKAIKPGGRAFFWENNATSNTMMWFRNHVIGKLWIPKHGDPDESPLAPYEVDHLRKHFSVTTEYPEMVFALMASRYLLRGRLDGHAVKVDKFLYRYPPIRKYSYRQFVCLK
ncbi:methyltransferase domain-containing protein [Paraburkholderia sp. Tr-20389]|uniref:class I SAM-dependent methyltransferase n=1 Tax=Paraburkholderia sp. Tr-20389 TaxID=2703903 RepID=UPI00197D97D0|nr:class I SAM-dependent methyltransferase [Paraburkholderia sp. Tr-20389]MBN3757150.1 methyltransferase domain-containing protein [Paraburkholderia sp. Tr-20389]